MPHGLYKTTVDLTLMACIIGMKLKKNEKLYDYGIIDYADVDLVGDRGELVARGR